MAPLTLPLSKLKSGLSSLQNSKRHRDEYRPSLEDVQTHVHEHPQEPIVHMDEAIIRGSIEATHSDESEQTSALAMHLNELALASTQPEVKLKHSRERSLLGIPPSTSKKDRALSSISSSASPMPSKPITRQNQQLWKRGAQKKLTLSGLYPSVDPSSSSSSAPHHSRPVTIDTKSNASLGTAAAPGHPTHTSSTATLMTDPWRAGPEQEDPPTLNGSHLAVRLSIDSTETSASSSSSSSTHRRASTLSRASSVSIERDHTPEPSYTSRRRQHLDDSDYVDTASRGSKRRAKAQLSSETSVRASGEYKRTRSPSAEVVKKPKAHDHRDTGGPLNQIRKRTSIDLLDGRKAAVPKGIISITGDEYAVKHNNDYCESCLGLGQFICCDTCPSAFHFSCCQPPMDPQCLPDEWSCNMCRAQLYPQPPNAPGIFKQLLDDIDQRNPRSFALPVEIRTYFKGVETNSDGEYVDTLDYKPSESIQGPGPHGGYSTSTTMDDMVQLRDKQGDIRICFHCGKSAHGRKLMISCEHCPLHWHLDCLDPPLASRPPTTRKWMCPNHVDHVLPKRRKRRDAHPVELVDPFAPNDGDIEIIDETSIHQIRATQIKASLMENPVEALYKIPERSVQLSFLAKCQQSLQQRSFQGGPRADPRGGKDETRLDRPRFEVLVAVMLACEGMEMGKLDSTDAVDAVADATVNLTDTDVAVNVDGKSRKRHREEVQDAVTSKLADSEDRDAYARFLAVQRAVREHGVETSIAQWTEAFQRDGDEKK